MMQTAIGVSDNLDGMEAIAEVISACQEQLGEVQPGAGILFTSIMKENHRQFLKEVRTAFPGIQLVGCTTDGEIIPGKGYLEDSIALLLMASDEVEFATSIATDLSVDPAASFQKAFSEAESKLEGKPALGLIFPDGLTTLALPFDQIINTVTAGQYPVFGGTAGDAFQFDGTFQFFEEEVYSDASPVLLIAGQVSLKSKICIGVEPIGRAYSVDKVEGNVVYAMDGDRASAVYEKLLGEYTYEDRVMQFPLAVFEETDQGLENAFCLRDPFRINKEDGSVTFIGTFPERSKVKFVAIDRGQILQSADDALSYIMEDENDLPELVFLFSCTSRKHALGSKVKEEFSTLLEHEKKIPFFGFYCYGEIGPTQHGDITRFHNDTVIAIGLHFSK